MWEPPTASPRHAGDVAEAFAALRRHTPFSAHRPSVPTHWIREAGAGVLRRARRTTRPSGADQVPEVIPGEMTLLLSPGPHRVDRRDAAAMRGVFTETIMATLRAPTFAVGSRLRESSIEANPVIGRVPTSSGFRAQIQAVSMGLEPMSRLASSTCPTSRRGSARTSARSGSTDVHAVRRRPGIPVVAGPTLGTTIPHDVAAPRKAGRRPGTTLGEASPTTRQE